VRFIGPVLKRYLNKYPDVSSFVRGDSGFAQPQLYKIIEELKSFYAIRLKANARLYKKAASITDRLNSHCTDNIYDYAVVYGEFMYRATKWDKSRRVVVKIEKPEGQMCYNYTFIVTNMTSVPKNSDVLLQ
ncbi:MAG: transposase, partial [Clostridium sp.]